MLSCPNILRIVVWLALDWLNVPWAPFYLWSNKPGKFWTAHSPSVPLPPYGGQMVDNVTSAAQAL